MFKSRTYHGVRISQFTRQVNKEILRPDAVMEEQTLDIPFFGGAKIKRFTCNYFDWGLGTTLGVKPMLMADPQGTLALAILRDCLEDHNRLRLRQLYLALRDRVIAGLPRDEWVLTTEQIEQSIEAELVLCALDGLDKHVPGVRSASDKEFFGG